MRSAFAYLIAIAIVLPGISAGQTSFPPTLLITWQADTFAPNDYRGKVLPVTNSRVYMVAQLFDRGKPVDLSQYEIRWFADTTLFDSGKGVSRTVFTPTSFSASSYRIRAVVVGYTGSFDVEAVTVVPVSQPTAVIDAPYRNNAITSASAPVRVRAYFFRTTKASDLSLEWRAGGTVVGQSTLDANSTLSVNAVGAPSGSLLRLALNVINTLVPGEQANTVINLKVQ